MSKINLYVVRHGERIDHIDPFWEKNAEFPYDPYLTEKGKSQAYKTGLYLRQFVENDPEIHVFSSPFLRCIQTSAGIKEGLLTNTLTKIEPHLCEWLTDEYYSRPVPPTIIETNINSPEYSKGIDANHKPFFDGLPGFPESHESLVSRTQKYVEIITNWALEQASKVKTSLFIVLVSHGATVGALVAAFTKKRIIVGVDYCSVSQIGYNYKESRWNLRGKYQDNAHLKEINELKHSI